MMRIDAFLKHLEDVKRYSSHTLLAYNEDISQFIEYCHKHELIDDWTLVTPKMVRRWEVLLMSGDQEISKKTLSPRSVRRKLSSLSTLFKYMMRQGEIEDNPVSMVVLPHLAKKLPEYVEPYQMNQLLDGDIFGESFGEIRDKLLILMAYMTGMRRSELVSLKVQDIDTSALNIRVTGKGDKQRLAPMTKELSALIQKYIVLRDDLVLGKHNTLFVTDKGAPIYDKFVYRLVVKYLSEVTTLHKRSPHILRHTFATALLNNGAGIETIRVLLGHSDLAATQVYTHTSIEGLKKIYNKAHPRAELGDE